MNNQIIPISDNGSNPDKFNFFIDLIRKSRLLRRKLGQWSHAMFFNIYLADYLQEPMANFHRDMFALTEANDKDLCIVAGFRDSGKSAIMNTSFALWSILSGRAHFIVIASDTLNQVRTHFSNIRKAFDSPLVRNDFGPIDFDGDERGAFGMTFKKFDARIIAISTQQAVRGLRFKHYRPDLIIVDDPEDLQGTRTKESRDHIYSWFVSEVIPLGTTKTKIFLIGNFLHEFSLIGRLVEQIKSGERSGTFRRYPLVNDEGVCQWPEKFKTPEALEAFKRKVGDDTTWRREYLLQTVASDDRVVPAEWIKHWTELPKENIRKVVIGVDLAISEKETADYTAVVVGLLAGFGKDFHAYIIKTVNRRMAFLETMELLKDLHDMYVKLCGAVEMRIENVAYQQAAIEYLKSKQCNVIGVSIATDKHSRLMTASALIQNGTVLFAPDPENSHLVQQLVGFGLEKFDDLCDSFTLLVNGIIGENSDLPQLWSLDTKTGKIETLGGNARDPQPEDDYAIVDIPDAPGLTEALKAGVPGTPGHPISQPRPQGGDISVASSGNAADPSTSTAPAEPNAHRPAVLGPSPRAGSSESGDERNSPPPLLHPALTLTPRVNPSGSGTVILPSGNAYRSSFLGPRQK